MTIETSDEDPIKINEYGNGLTFFGYRFRANLIGSKDELTERLGTLREVYLRKLNRHVEYENTNDSTILPTNVIDYDGEAFVLLFGAMIGPLFHGPDRMEKAKNLMLDVNKHLNDYVYKHGTSFGHLKK